MDVVLESIFPYWAIAALRYMPNLGDYKSKLIAKSNLPLTLMDDLKFQNNELLGNDQGLNIPQISKIKL